MNTQLITSLRTQGKFLCLHEFLKIEAVKTKLRILNQESNHKKREQTLEVNLRPKVIKLILIQTTISKNKTPNQ